MSRLTHRLIQLDACLRERDRQQEREALSIDTIKVIEAARDVVNTWKIEQAGRA